MAEKKRQGRRKEHYDVEEHYNRKNWLPSGRKWFQTRQTVLEGSSEQMPVFLTPSRKKVTGGSWTDPYTGINTSDVKSLHIDHTVALREAFGSGGFRWSPEKKQKFAHSVRRGHLRPIGADVNIQKSWHDVSKWIPEKDPVKYARETEKIKERWGLSADPDEAKWYETLLGRKTRLKVGPAVEDTFYCKSCHGGNPYSNNKRGKSLLAR